MENGEEDPAFSAAAAWLVSKLSGSLKATKQLQDKENSPPSREDSFFERMKTGGTAEFRNQEPIFDMLPGPIRARALNECGVRWRQPPLVNWLVNDRTSHLALYLRRTSYLYPSSKYPGEGWTLQDVDELCKKIARECTTSLRSLDITIKPKWTDFLKLPKDLRDIMGESDPAPPQPPAPDGPGETPPAESHPGVTATQLCALLQEVRGLVKLHLQGDFTEQEIDSIISTLADTNPGIRDLRMSGLGLSNLSLSKIADTWPELEVLEASSFDSPGLAAVLPRLRNLRLLHGEGVLQATYRVAHQHDPTTPPYQLTERNFSFHGYAEYLEVGSETVGKLLDTFPAVDELSLSYKDIPVVCAGLQGRAHIGITKLNCDITQSNGRPRVLEPLLALLGKNLRELWVHSDWHDDDDGHHVDSVDVSMIGHYCRNLQGLSLSAKTFVAGDLYKVTPSYFSKLQSFWLSCVSVPARVVHLPAPLVLRLLASPHLKDIESYEMLISEEVMASLAAQSGEQRALSSLEKVTMLPRSASVRVFASLLSLAPRLRELNLLRPVLPQERETVGVLTAFLRQTGLRARIQTAPSPESNPGCLRMSRPGYII